MAATSKKTASAKKEASLRPKLHLSSLKIENFRGLKSLEIPRLGRVTLLAGKNGTGKTTVLEAVRLYAACGEVNEIRNILRGRDEMKIHEDEDGDQISAPDWKSLFFGRRVMSSDTDILAVGPVSNGNTLKIAVVPLADWDDKDIRVFSRRMPISEIPDMVLKISFRKKDYKIPIWDTVTPFSHRMLARFGEGIRKLRIKSVSLGPDVPDNDFIADYWEDIALTDQEEWALQALNLVIRHGGKLQGVSVLAGRHRRFPRSPGNRIMSPEPRIIVRSEDYKEPFPLKSLGDGAFRLFAVALALVNARDGFLFIDEVENGLHHSIQYDFWKMVLQTAHDNNVQVLATTHGWSCVEGFARAANDLQDIEGVLARIERKGDKTRSVEYNEEDLKIAAEQGIEVR